VSIANLKRVALAILIGSIGGWVFYSLNMPLPWMMGSMIFVAAATIAGAPVALSLPLRTSMVAALGALLGSAFTPDIVDQLVHWASGVGLMAVFVTVMTAASIAMLVRFGHFDRVTAYFSGTPGGLGVMTVLGEQAGGDPRVIPLVHATRVFVVVLAIPLYLLLVEGLDVPRGARAVVEGPTAGPDELLILGACAVVGYFAARTLRLPGAMIIGPMLVSAAAYLSGIVVSPPPSVLISVAQVVMGAGIGVRFAGLEVRRMAWPLLFGVLSAALMLAGAMLMAGLAAPWLGLSRTALLLALAPGGLAEMSMIALALDVDTAFIATMHVIRIMMIVALAPAAFRLIGWNAASPTVSNGSDAAD